MHPMRQGLWAHWSYSRRGKKTRDSRLVFEVYEQGCEGAVKTSSNKWRGTLSAVEWVDGWIGAMARQVIDIRMGRVIGKMIGHQCEKSRVIHSIPDRWWIHAQQRNSRFTETTRLKCLNCLIHTSAEWLVGCIWPRAWYHWCAGQWKWSFVDCE